MIRCNRRKLMNMLAASMREAPIAGTKVPQVHSCIIRYSTDGVLETTSLVRDGVSSVHSLRFTTDTPPSEDGMIVVPSIVSLLGVLKMHKADTVSLKQTQEKLKITSSNKQTTILANLHALAYPGARSSVLIWEQQSKRIMGKVMKHQETGNLLYIGENDEVFEPDLELDAIAASVLAEAFSFDSMNSQNKGLWSLEISPGGEVFVVSGEDMKGRTVCKIYEANTLAKGLKIELNGGLHSLFTTHLSQDTRISLFDFRDKNQGWRVVFSSDDGMVVQIGRDNHDN